MKISCPDCFGSGGRRAGIEVVTGMGGSRNEVIYDRCKTCGGTGEIDIDPPDEHAELKLRILQLERVVNAISYGLVKGATYSEFADIIQAECGGDVDLAPHSKPNRVTLEQWDGDHQEPEKPVVTIMQLEYENSHANLLAALDRIAWLQSEDYANDFLAFCAAQNIAAEAGKKGQLLVEKWAQVAR